MDTVQALAVSFAMALLFTLVFSRVVRARRTRRMMETPVVSVEQQELRYMVMSPGDLVNRLGESAALAMLAEDYPEEASDSKGLWWYLRRRVATELTRRQVATQDALESFYGLALDADHAPDDKAKVRQAVLSYMCGPDRSLFPFEDVQVRPPMPLRLFLLCRANEEPHPVLYPGAWFWMTVSEFATVVNPNRKLGEHFVVEPPDMGRDGQSARVRFRWGTPPGVHMQDVEVRRLGSGWFVHSIRDTFKLR